MNGFCTPTIGREGTSLRPPVAGCNTPCASIMPSLVINRNKSKKQATIVKAERMTTGSGGSAIFI